MCVWTLCWTEAQGDLIQAQPGHISCPYTCIFPEWCWSLGGKGNKLFSILKILLFVISELNILGEKKKNTWKESYFLWIATQPLDTFYSHWTKWGGWCFPVELEWRHTFVIPLEIFWHLPSVLWCLWPVLNATTAEVQSGQCLVSANTKIRLFPLKTPHSSPPAPKSCAGKARKWYCTKYLFLLLWVYLHNLGNHIIRFHI